MNESSFLVTRAYGRNNFNSIPIGPRANLLAATVSTLLVPLLQITNMRAIQSRNRRRSAENLA